MLRNFVESVHFVGLALFFVRPSAVWYFQTTIKPVEVRQMRNVHLG